MFGDKGYVNSALKRLARKAGVCWGVSLKASKPQPLRGTNKRVNRRRCSIVPAQDVIDAARLHRHRAQGGRSKQAG